jgi:ribose 5-phosphate isomerase RpiB
MNTIVIGSDHAGFPIKKSLMQALSPAYNRLHNLVIAAVG